MSSYLSNDPVAVLELHKGFFKVVPCCSCMFLQVLLNHHPQHIFSYCTGYRVPSEGIEVFHSVVKSRGQLFS